MMTPWQFYCVLLFSTAAACLMASVASGAPDATRGRLLVASLCCICALLSALFAVYVLAPL